MNKFFEWAYLTRANVVKKLADGEQISPEKLFLSFTSHSPVFISHGDAGLNGSVKGVGFLPYKDYLQDMLFDYLEHIKTYDPKDKAYQQRGLQILIKHIYSKEAEKNIDFSRLYGIEMAYKNSYKNYQKNEEASLVFYQPPMISYELKGKIKILGEKFEGNFDIKPSELPIIQQIVNAQHDVYHSANPDIWKTRQIYEFNIEEIWDKSAGKNGFGTLIEKYI